MSYFSFFAYFISNRHMLQIVMTAGLILFSARNQQNNLFQTLIGLILFSTSADRVVYGILAHLGISTAYSTTVQ